MVKVRVVPAAHPDDVLEAVKEGIELVYGKRNSFVYVFEVVPLVIVTEIVGGTSGFCCPIPEFGEFRLTQTESLCVEPTIKYS